MRLFDKCHQHADGIRAKYCPRVEFCNLRVQASLRANGTQGKVMRVHNLDRKLRKCYPRGKVWVSMLSL